jgi:hypothetical protein
VIRRKDVVEERRCTIQQLNPRYKPLSTKCRIQSREGKKEDNQVKMFKDSNYSTKCLDVDDVDIRRSSEYIIE